MPQTWWVTTALNEGGPPFLVSWVVWVIGSICLHELSHGWTAIRHGDDTPILTGHMTWNPLVHMGAQSLILFALIGIAWGAMPVNPTRLRGRHADAKVAAAGPLMNIGLALASTVGGAIVLLLARRAIAAGGSPGATLDNFFMFFMLGTALNIALAVLNLMPFPPLDGWRIGSSLVPAYGRLFGTSGGMLVGLAGFFAIFFFGGKYIFGFAIGASHWLIDHAAQLVVAGP